VFLELTDSHDKKFKYQYCIEMLYSCSNKHPSRNYKKEYVSDFEDGESWGYRKFYELAKLVSKNTSSCLAQHCFHGDCRRVMGS
jgi:hypothetical protein